MVESLNGGHRALVVGINYAPEETGIGPYTSDLAEHLSAQGWAVTVLTGMPHYPEWQLHESYRGSLRRREQRAGVCVRRFRHYIPTKHHAGSRGLYELTFFAQAVSATGLERPDRIVGVVPSLGGGAVAALFARRYRAPLGLIMQDLVGLAAAESGVPGGGIVAGPTKALEGWIVRQASGVAVVSESFIRHLEGAGVRRDRLVHLPNWVHVAKPTGRAAETRRQLGWRADEQIALHAGNMGYKQGLENVVRAARLAAAEAVPVRFVLMGDGTDRRRLEAIAADVPTLQFLGVQPAESFMDVLGAADVLIVNESGSVGDMCLPSKLTSYFRAGRPVVAAVQPHGATGTELERSGGGLIVPPENPQALLEGVRKVCADVALAGTMVANGARHGAIHYDRGQTLKRAESFIDSLSSRHAASLTKARVV